MLSIKIVLFTVVVTFLVTSLMTKKLIPVLKQNQIGQKILEIGPNWHKKKEGTPTMGGVSFVASSLASLLFVFIAFQNDIDQREKLLLINVFAYGMLNFFVGVVDDLAKMKKKENKGLSAIGKLILQCFSSSLFLLSLSVTKCINTVIKIPFTDFEWDMGYFYYAFALVLLVGMVNAVNLTDGLDGLASTCSLTVGAFFIVAGIVLEDTIFSSFLGACLIGVAMGFLVFNLYPAKIFMGDSGSLYLGALVAGSGVAIGNPILVLIYGGVFFIEAISVMLQVAYFKLSGGKRLFKMAPIHHHFEKSGFSEMQIVTIFGITNTIFCAFAFLGLVL